MMLNGVPADSAMNMEDVVFDVDFYHNKYPDLQNAFHHDNAKLLNHWKTYGIKEGRACSEMLDLTFYLGNYPDLQKAFGQDYTKAYKHFFEYGINELRQSSPTYNPKVYQVVYPFLNTLSPRQLLWHYRNLGRPQGMIATMGFSALPVAPMPTMAPQDMVFDADFYHNKYPDLQNAFHHDNAKLLNHWKTYGIKEGRACSEVLDLTFYLNKYPDLQKAFGQDYTKAYNHFFEYGINELRHSSPTYNPTVYQQRFGLQGLSPLQLIHHFMSYGRFHCMWAY